MSHRSSLRAPGADDLGQASRADSGSRGRAGLARPSPTAGRLRTQGSSPSQSPREGRSQVSSDGSSQRDGRSQGSCGSSSRAGRGPGSSHGASRGPSSLNESVVADGNLDDKFSAVREYFQDQPARRMQSIDTRTLIKAQGILREQAARTASKLPNERAKQLGAGCRFKFELGLISLAPKKDGQQHPSDVMTTLFHVPVHRTMFEVPEFSLPLSQFSVPKWVMAERSVQDKVLYDVDSPWYDPVVYSTWRDNIRACFAVMNTHYDVRQETHPATTTRIAIAPPFRANQARALTLSELQNIAIAIVHFEDHLQSSLMRGLWQNRNWQDNPKLKKKSRVQAIVAIQRTKTIQELVNLTSPKSGNYVWELWRPDSIVFVAAGVTETADETIKRIEPIIQFLACCLEITNQVEVSLQATNAVGYMNFITLMESKHRPAETDGSRFCQPSLERLGSLNLQDHDYPPAPRRGLMGRILPNRGGRRL